MTKPKYQTVFQIDARFPQVIDAIFKRPVIKFLKWRLQRSVGYSKLYITPFLRINNWLSNFKHVSFGWLRWSWDLWLKP